MQNFRKMEFTPTPPPPSATPSGVEYAPYFNRIDVEMITVQFLFISVISLLSSSSYLLFH